MTLVSESRWEAARTSAFKLTRADKGGRNSRCGTAVVPRHVPKHSGFKALEERAAANAGIPRRGFFKRSEVPGSDVLLDVVRLAASRNEADLILSEYRSLCKGVVS